MNQRSPNQQDQNGPRENRDNVYRHRPGVEPQGRHDTALRGMGGDLPLMRWLQDVMWPAEGRLEAADVKAAMIANQDDGFPRTRRYPSLDFVALATGMGVPATRATTAEELADQLRTALAEPGPHLIDAVLRKD